MTTDEMKLLAWYIAIAIANTMQSEPNTFEELFGESEVA